MAVFLSLPAELLDYENETDRILDRRDRISRPRLGVTAVLTTTTGIRR